MDDIAANRPAEYAIRLATEADLPTLPSIEESAGRLFAGYDASETGDVNVTADRHLTHQAVQDERLWVAMHGTDVVGFALATEIDGEAHLYEIDVLPEHGRRGVGRALIETVRRWASTKGYPAVTLSTRQDVPFNGPFYARLGFATVVDDALTPGLQALRAEEERRGLDLSRRAIMRLAL